MERRGWLLVSVLLSAAVLVVLLVLTVDETTLVALDDLDWRWLAVAVASHLAALLSWAGRVRVLAAGLGYRVPYRRCVSLVFANVLAASITPASAGGEPVRAHELYRAGVAAGDATAVVVAERLLDVLLLFAGVAIAVLVLGRQLVALGVSGGPLVPAIGLFVLGFVGLLLVALRWPRALAGALRRLAALLGRVLPAGAAAWLERRSGLLDREVGLFRAAFGRFATRGIGHLAAGLALSAGYWLCEFAVASFLLLALGLPPNWVLSLLCQMLINVVSLLPITPGGAGLAEASAASLYGLFVPSSSLGVFVALWRLIVYHLNILIGLASSLAIVRRETERRGTVREP